MSTKFILCSACGTKNRLGEGDGTPRCGQCGKDLHINAKKGSGSETSWGKIIAILILVWVGWSVLSDKPASTYKPSTSSYHSGTAESAAPAPIAPVFNQPVLPISFGVLTHVGEGISPLQVKTAPGENYYLKLVDIDTGQAVMTAYVPGGETFTTLVPLGNYYLRYATGQNWYGVNYLFGPDTQYAQADTVLDYVCDYNSCSEFEMELIARTGGNMRTKTLTVSQF